MYVIADIKWVEAAGKKSWIFPTQIAAIRIDDGMNIISEFFSFVKPKHKAFSGWNHIAYKGGSAKDFYNSGNAQHVLTEFSEWLNKSDIIIWWHSENESMYHYFITKYLDATVPQQTVNIRMQINGLLNADSAYSRRMYKLAGAVGIDTQPKLEHHSPNDVRVLYELMKLCGCPPEQIINSASASDERRTSARPEPKTKVLREKNAEFIKRAGYAFVFTPSSKIFHKPNCPRILGAKRVMGVIKYESIERLGKTPCKVCAPGPEDAGTAIPNNAKRGIIKGFENASLSQEEHRAIKRWREALRVRKRLLRKTKLSDAQKKDIITLTQPQYAFFAGAGYNIFHLYGCKKLRGAKDIRGFSRCKNALDEGYIPCKFCKPTNKHDITASIPIDNRLRKEENVSDLMARCAQKGYAYSYENKLFCIETSAGKWRFKVTDPPLRLEHINLIMSPDCTEYHKQPRVFLSLHDTLKYIERHDKYLLKEHAEGKTRTYFAAGT